MKKILAVGAFERDNFGDLLFLKLLRDVMRGKDVEIIPASIIFSDMRKINDEIVYPYDLMLKLYEWDVVWVVGGEVGGVDIAGAVLMDAIDEKGQHYSSLDSDDRACYNSLLDIPRGDNLSAYLPNARSYTKNRRVTMVVNSVGLSNSAVGTDMSKNEIAVLSNSVVSVREGASAKFCRDNKIAHTLSPDVVSAISHFHPSKVNRTQAPYVVVQVNYDLLSKTKIMDFAKILSEIGEYLDAKIVLLRAGTTFSHDDDTLYKKIVSDFNALNSKCRIEQYEERDPLSIVDLIAGSKLCIATSLHCRIVSESYGTPHISLSNAKVANYAATWIEDEYPCDVSIDLLIKTVSDIKHRIDKPIKNDILGKKALENIEKICNKILINNNNHCRADNPGGNWDELYLGYMSKQKTILDGMFSRLLVERNTSTVKIQELERQKDEAFSKNVELERHKLELTNSISWKITKPLRFAKRAARRLLRRH